MVEYAFYPPKSSGVVFIFDQSLGEGIERTQQVPYVVSSTRSVHIHWLRGDGTDTSILWHI